MMKKDLVEILKRMSQFSGRMTPAFKRILNWLRLVPAWVYILAAGTLVFWTYQVRVPCDLGIHSNAGLNMLEGRGYVDAAWAYEFKKPPLWPYILKLFFSVFGVSYTSSFFAVRLFAVLNPVLVYFLGRSFFNARVGVGAAALALTSFTVLHTSYRHLDGVWVTFALLGVLLAECAFKRRSVWWFMLCGLAFGAAVLVKQAAFLLLPYPLLLLVFRDNRGRGAFLGLVAYSIVVLACVLPWVYWVFVSADNVAAGLFSNAGNFALSEGQGLGLRSAMHKAAAGVWDYFFDQPRSFNVVFSIAPLLLTAWLYSLGRAVRRDTPHLKFAMLFLLLLPFISVTGHGQYRVGQQIFFFLLTFIVASAFVQEVLDWICSRLQGSSTDACLRWARNGFVTVLAALCLTQITVRHGRDLGSAFFYRRSEAYQCYARVTRHGLGVLWGSKGVTLQANTAGPFGDDGLRVVAADLAARLEPGQSVMVDEINAASAMYFMMGGKFPVHRFPFTLLRKNAVIWGDGPLIAREKPAYLTADMNALMGSKNFYMLFGSVLRDSVVAKNIQYVVLTKFYNGLDMFFARSAGVEQVAKYASDRYGVFRIFAVDEGFRAIAPETPYFTKEFQLMMHVLARKSGSEFDHFTETYLKRFASMTDEDIRRVMETLPVEKTKGL